MFKENQTYETSISDAVNTLRIPWNSGICGDHSRDNHLDYFLCNPFQDLELTSTQAGSRRGLAADYLLVACPVGICSVPAFLRVVLGDDMKWKHGYSLRTHLLWDIERICNVLSTWFQHRRVQSQLKDKIWLNQ